MAEIYAIITALCQMLIIPELIRYNLAKTPLQYSTGRKAAKVT